MGQIFRVIDFEKFSQSLELVPSFKIETTDPFRLSSLARTQCSIYGLQLASKGRRQPQLFNTAGCICSPEIIKMFFYEIFLLMTKEILHLPMVSWKQPEGQCLNTKLDLPPSSMILLSIIFVEGCMFH